MAIETLTRTWTKTTSTGKTVVITITMSESGWRSASAMVDGKSYSASFSGLKLSQPQQIGPVVAVAAIHANGLGNIGLTQAEYDAFRAVLADQDAAMDADPTLPVLVERRKSLGRDLGYAIEAASDGAARRFDRYDNGYCSTPREDAAIAKAQADLAAFDAARPEVAIEIERQRAADVAHFLAVD